MWNDRWVGHLIGQHLSHISDKTFPCGFTPLETVPQIPEILEISGTWWWIKIRWQNHMNNQVVPGSDWVKAVAQVDVQFVVSGRALRCHEQGISQVPGTKEQNLWSYMNQVLVYKCKKLNTFVSDYSPLWQCLVYPGKSPRRWRPLNRRMDWSWEEHQLDKKPSGSENTTTDSSEAASFYFYLNLTSRLYSRSLTKRKIIFRKMGV